MTDIEKSLTISAPLNRVWAALTDPAALGEWMSDDSVEVDLRLDGLYSLFGGETTGHFTYLKAPRSLEYTWRQGEWPREWADSIVRWELEPAGVDTRVHLLHKNFPNDEDVLATTMVGIATGSNLCRNGWKIRSIISSPSRSYHWKQKR